MQVRSRDAGSLTLPVAVGTHAGSRASLGCSNREAAPQSRSGMLAASSAAGGGGWGWGGVLRRSRRGQRASSQARTHPHIPPGSRPALLRNSTESLRGRAPLTSARVDGCVEQKTPTSGRRSAASSSEAQLLLLLFSLSPALPNSLLSHSISV